MPRCYMVKKVMVKTNGGLQRDCFDQNSSGYNGAPGSPTEGSVAPLCYTPLTNRTSQSQDYNNVANSEATEGAIHAQTKRSPEETEAAHDLLSLSQSLPPLQAPSVVMIHHSIPIGEEQYGDQHLTSSALDESATGDKGNSANTPVDSPRPIQSCSEVEQSVQQVAPVVAPAMPSVVMPCPIVYIVEMPGNDIIPPASNGSLDTDNVQYGFVERYSANDENIPEQNNDIMILPLSPLPMSQNAGICTEEGKMKPDVASAKFSLSDKRKRVNKRMRNGNTSENLSNSLASDGNVQARLIEPIASTSKTKFYKVVEDDDEEEEIDVIGTDDSGRNRYICPDCGKQYATSSNLSRHKQTHRSLYSKSAKKCTFCDKKYVSMPALSMHLLTHKLIHRCDECGKQFSRPWLLQGHLRSHTGEKPYGCAHCGKAFADRSNLRAHMQTHSSDKIYSCPKCSKTFALKSYLNKHMESACQVVDWKSFRKFKKATKHAETQTATTD